MPLHHDILFESRCSKCDKCIASKVTLQEAIPMSEITMYIISRKLPNSDKEEFFIARDLDLLLFLVGDESNNNEYAEFVLGNDALSVFEEATNSNDPDNMTHIPIFACTDTSMWHEVQVVSLYKTPEEASAHFDYLLDESVFPREYNDDFVDQMKPNVDRIARQIAEDPMTYHRINSDERDGIENQLLSLDSATYEYIPVYVIR